MMPRPETSRRQVLTGLSTIHWSDDGARVTKRHEPGTNAEKLGPRTIILDHHRPGSNHWARHFAYELRVNQLLTRHRPPVPTPRLLGHDRKALTMEFEAVAGYRLGPKFPLELATPDLEALVALASALPSYHPRPRWLRTLPVQSRLRRAHRLGLLGSDEYPALQEVVSRVQMRWAFAHADINPSNVVVTDEGLVLVDWEWAGLYPAGYDLAFLWFVLVDLPESRVFVERRIHGDPTSFWLSALLIQLLHLEWLPSDYLPRHEATRDALVERLLARPYRDDGHPDR
jgi:Phosphotransferase enzyme family